MPRMDISVTEGASLWQRNDVRPGPYSPSAIIFVMDWAAVWLRTHRRRPFDCGVRSPAWVPHEFWQSFLFWTGPSVVCRHALGANHRPARPRVVFLRLLGPENIPAGRGAVERPASAFLAGVIAFIFADLIVLPGPQYLPEVLWG